MNSTIQNEINVGIDISQAFMDVYIRPSAEYRSFSNDAAGIKQAIRFIRSFHPARVLIEATGRLEMAFFCAADKAGLPVCVCNPARVRDFAKSTGRMAKTDKLDAGDLAHFGEVIKPAITQLKPEKTRLISDLLAVRSQCLGMSTMQKNRLKRMPKTVQAPIRNILKKITEEIAQIDRKLDRLIAEVVEPD